MEAQFVQETHSMYMLHPGGAEKKHVIGTLQADRRSRRRIWRLQSKLLKPAWLCTTVQLLSLIEATAVSRVKLVSLFGLDNEHADAANKQLNTLIC